MADYVNLYINGTRGAKKNIKIKAPGEPPAVISKVKLDCGMEQGLSNKWDGTTCWFRSCRLANITKLEAD